MKASPMALTRKIVAVAGFAFLVSSLAATGCSDNGAGPGNGDNGNGNGEDTVSFAKILTDILEPNCSGGACHIPGPEASTELSLKDWQAVKNGSINGAIVIAGDPDNSELIKRLEGTSTPQMPLGLSPLASSQIDQIRTWIEQGALDN